MAGGRASASTLSQHTGEPFVFGFEFGEGRALIVLFKALDWL